MGERRSGDRHAAEMLVTGWTQEEEQVSAGDGEPGSGPDTVGVRCLGDNWGPVGSPGLILSSVLSCPGSSWLPLVANPPLPHGPCFLNPKSERLPSVPALKAFCLTHTLQLHLLCLRVCPHPLCPLPFAHPGSTTDPRSSYSVHSGMLGHSPGGGGGQ